MSGDAWAKAVDLGTISTALLVIAFAVLLYVSRKNSPQKHKR